MNTVWVLVDYIDVVVTIDPSLQVTPLSPTFNSKWYSIFVCLMFSKRLAKNAQEETKARTHAAVQINDNLNVQNIKIIDHLPRPST